MAPHDVYTRRRDKVQIQAQRRVAPLHERHGANERVIYALQTQPLLRAMFERACQCAHERRQHFGAELTIVANPYSQPPRQRTYSAELVVETAFTVDAIAPFVSGYQFRTVAIVDDQSGLPSADDATFVGLIQNIDTLGDATLEACCAAVAR